MTALNFVLIGLFLLLSYYMTVPYKPKFKVGDIIELPCKYEEWEQDDRIKLVILQVGKNKYLVKIDGSHERRGESMAFIDTFYIKVRD